MTEEPFELRRFGLADRSSGYTVRHGMRVVERIASDVRPRSIFSWGAVGAIAALIVASCVVVFHNEISLALSDETPDRIDWAAWAERAIAQAPSDKLSKPDKSARPSKNPLGQDNGYFDERDDSVVCGRGWSRMCVKHLLPGGAGFNTDYRPTMLVFPEDRRLCRSYYDYVVRTGRTDPTVDWYCYQRWLTPTLVPDPLR
jgi:hypothetical protein